MSELKFACPNCDQHIACDESYGGRELNCPTCDTLMEVPQAAPGLSLQAAAAPACPSCNTPVLQYAVMCTQCGYNFRTRQPRQAASTTRTRSKSRESRQGDVFDQNRWIIISIAVGLVIALGATLLQGGPWGAARSSVFLGTFLVSSGFVMTLVTGVKILINAFRESTWWGIGMLTPCINGFVWIGFIIRHWSQNRALVLANVGASVALVVGGTILPEDEQGTASSPQDAFTEFRQAMVAKDYSTAFQYLTPESQVRWIAIPVIPLVTMKAFTARPGVRVEGPDMSGVEAVLQRHGISIEPGHFSEDTLRDLPDKAALFGELVAAFPDSEGQLMDFRGSTLTQLTITGNMASGLIDGEPIGFQKSADGGWLIQWGE